MRKFNYLLIGFVMTGLVILTAGCSEKEQTTKVTAIGTEELDPAIWGKSYPLQYASYLKNNEVLVTDFGGSVKDSKYVTEPEILELFKGYGFSKEYNEDRGHTYALEDLLASKRVDTKTPGSCMTCKSPSVPKLITDLGGAYYKTPLLELAKDVKHPIACADCHNPTNMELQVTRPAFIEAMKARGIDVNSQQGLTSRSKVLCLCPVPCRILPRERH